MTTPGFTDYRKLDDHVRAALEMSGSKKRFRGVVSKINGTTTVIKSGDREFLAWSKPELMVGTPVEFTIDQFRAKNVQVL